MTIKLTFLWRLMITGTAFAQQSGVKMGAYYFDGWSGTYPYHITSSLVDSFPEREPKWGWRTSSQDIVDQQIKEAADAGLGFFSFCWYFAGQTNYRNEALNRALSFYQKSKNKSRLNFCLMVANHKGFEIGPLDWDFVSSEWIKYFVDASYLQVNKRPLIIFFSFNDLLKSFESEENLAAAFQKLRDNARTQGLRGVSIAVCMNNTASDTLIKTAENCGVDILTGYNYHSAGFGNKRVIPVDSLLISERRVWDDLSNRTKLKYIPVSTMNWDPRPWANKSNDYNKAPYYTGFSPASVYRSITNCVNWITSNQSKVPAEKIGILYAWNENGEGAYLTPSKNGTNMLDGVKKALKAQIRN